jgi:hypothetical protein
LERYKKASTTHADKGKNEIFEIIYELDENWPKEGI